MVITYIHYKLELNAVCDEFTELFIFNCGFQSMFLCDLDSSNDRLGPGQGNSMYQDERPETQTWV